MRVCNHWRIDRWWQCVLRAKGAHIHTHTHTHTHTHKHTHTVCHTMNTICHAFKAFWVICKRTKKKADLTIQMTQMPRVKETSDCSLGDRCSISWRLYRCGWMLDCQHDSAGLTLNPNKKVVWHDMSLFAQSVTASLTNRPICHTESLENVKKVRNVNCKPNYIQFLWIMNQRRIVLLKRAPYCLLH